VLGDEARGCTLTVTGSVAGVPAEAVEPAENPAAALTGACWSVDTQAQSNASAERPNKLCNERMAPSSWIGA